MGYSTEFIGEFKIKPNLKPEDREFLNKLARTRRMARNVDPKYGVEGEFYVDGSDEWDDQGRNKDIIDYNVPPKTQPGLWLQWVPTIDGDALEWDGGEKFYSYVEWLQYLIEKILKPRGYTVNGQVEWLGEDPDDRGLIIVKDNTVTTKIAKITYE